MSKLFDVDWINTIVTIGNVSKYYLFLIALNFCQLTEMPMFRINKQRMNLPQEHGSYKLLTLLSGS